MGVLRYNVSKSGRSDGNVRTLMEEIRRNFGEVTSGMLCLHFSSLLCGSKVTEVVIT